MLYRAREELAKVGRPAVGWVDWVRFAKGMVGFLTSLDTISDDDGIDTVQWMELVEGLEHGGRAVSAEGIDHHMPPLRGWANRGQGSLVQMFDDIVGVVEGLVVD